MNAELWAYISHYMAQSITNASDDKFYFNNVKHNNVNIMLTCSSTSIFNKLLWLKRLILSVVLIKHDRTYFYILSFYILGHTSSLGVYYTIWDQWRMGEV